MKRNGVLSVSMLLGLAHPIALGACHRDEAPGSCHRERDNVCVEYPAPVAAAGKRMCAAGTWRDGASTCPTTGRVGRCVKKAAGEPELLYSGAPNNYTLESARSSCEFAGGTFAATTAP